jgi:hypothetical protein
VLKWYAHGRLWESPGEVWQVRLKAREAAQRDRRGRDWRPGGEHKDPRERFKKETFQARKRRDKKAANLAGTGAARNVARDVARVFRPAEDVPRNPAKEPADPGRTAPSHKTRRPQLRKPR